MRGSALLEPLTILDGTMYDRCMSEFSEICEDQIQSAGRILVSKMESAAENERCSLKQKLTALNPEAEICVSHYTEQGDDWWDSLLTSYLDKEIPMKEERELDLENIGLTEVSLQSEQELILFAGSSCGCVRRYLQSKRISSGGKWMASL